MNKRDNIPDDAELGLMVSEAKFCCEASKYIHETTQKEIAAIALSISRGMDNLHRQNYMHRNLTSNNVLLDSCGTPKICDLGVSREMNARGGEESVTKGQGTPVYMSPQMRTGSYTSKGDVWSFGILITEMTHDEILDSAFAALPLAQQKSFLGEQKRSLPPPDVEELNRLCLEAELAIIECLATREACLRTVNTLLHSPDSPLFAPPAISGTLYTAPDFLFLVVQTCLSICESNRLPFTVIVQTLLCCCTSAAVALSSSPSTGLPQDQVNDTIAKWLVTRSHYFCCFTFKNKHSVSCLCFFEGVDGGV
ncbi:Protein kinase domain [Pelomyxa schiedti]|nr:Protein kinase domain [Pelomyxa schiedti]